MPPPCLGLLGHLVVEEFKRSGFHDLDLFHDQLPILHIVEAKQIKDHTVVQPNHPAWSHAPLRLAAQEHQEGLVMLRPHFKINWLGGLFRQFDAVELGILQRLVAWCAVTIEPMIDGAC